jgi:hypothetical protein
MKGAEVLGRCFTPLCVLVMLCVALPSFGQLYVSDDFEDANVSEDIWEIISGDWQVADGVFHQLAQGDSWIVAMVAPDKCNN